jgi:AraC-like DNA-binding protein
MLSSHTIRRWSTRDIPKSARLDRWLDRVGTATLPVTDWSGISDDFSAELEEASLGCLLSMKETLVGAPHARRTRRDVEESTEFAFCLFLCDSPHEWSFRGQNRRVRAGDVVLIGPGEHDSYMTASGFESNILKLPGHWLESWLPDPTILLGRAIPKDSKWGRVLSPMVRQLTPEVAAAPPLPHGVLVDQLGVTLALVAGESEARAMPDLLQRAEDCIGQRYSDRQLTAADVAASLDIAPRMLHRVLAAGNRTFASCLLDARADAAVRMLTSPSFRGLTLDEIGRQSGFLTTSYFARVVRKRTGRTPAELRCEAC